jgi:hypothetical protein
MNTDLKSLSNAELMSKIATLCELERAASIVKEIDSVDMTIQSMIAVKNALIALRDELMLRTAEEGSILNRANSLQAYYRLCSNIRAYDSYLITANTIKVGNITSSNLKAALLAGASQIDIASL